MSEERKRILNLLADGKISVDEAERLIGAVSVGQRLAGAAATEACCEGAGVDCCTDESEDCCAPGSDCCQEAGAGASAAAQEGQAASGKAATPPKYLCVKVQDGNDNVNVRVPIALLKAGMQLRSLMPEKARAQVDEKLAEHGVHFTGKNVDEVIAQLCQCQIDIKGKRGETVQVCCQ